MKKQYCSFSNLTYSQWYDGAILGNPLPGQLGSDEGYVMFYGDHATGWITPEYYYWRSYNGIEEPADKFESAMF